MIQCVHEQNSDWTETETEIDLENFAECLVWSIHWIQPTQTSKSFVSLALQFIEFKQPKENTEDTK